MQIPASKVPLQVFRHPPPGHPQEFRPDLTTPRLEHSSAALYDLSIYTGDTFSHANGKDKVRHEAAIRPTEVILFTSLWFTHLKNHHSSLNELAAGWVAQSASVIALRNRFVLTTTLRSALIHPLSGRYAWLRASLPEDQAFARNGGDVLVT